MFATEENASLLALLYEKRKEDTWSSLAQEVLTEGSATRIFNHRIDPHCRLESSDDEETWEEADGQEGLFPQSEVVDPADKERLKKARRKALLDLQGWQDEGDEFMSVLDEAFPSRLKTTINTPPFLFKKGLLDKDHYGELGVSVVGSRQCTPEGRRFAQDIATACVQAGLTVIAGLAAGIDSAAHQATVDAGGRTVAFIGTGINRVYPRGNRSLEREIIDHGGLVLSQFFPAQPPTRKTFPMRNALMSSYGIATVIVEASEYSGTRIQARQAQLHGRPILIRRQVLETTSWAKRYVDKPAVFIVDDVEQTMRYLDFIRQLEDGPQAFLDMLKKNSSVTA